MNKRPKVWSRNGLIRVMPGYGVLWSNKVVLARNTKDTIYSGNTDPWGASVHCMIFMIWFIGGLCLKYSCISDHFRQYDTILLLFLKRFRLFRTCYHKVQPCSTLINWCCEDLGSDGILLYYTLSSEYRVVRNRYSRLLFTSEDRLCANLRVQEQSGNMTSQCQCPTFAWLHRTTVVTSQY